MVRVKMPDSKQSAAFGYEHRTAAYKKRLALEKKFSSGFKIQTGEVQRAPRTGSARASAAANQRAQEAWIMNHLEHFEWVVEQFIGAAATLGVSADSIEDLQDELEEAKGVSGRWASVVPYLRIAAREADAAMSHSDKARGAADSAPLAEAKSLLHALDHQ
jgi:hypothetical protein